MSLNIERLIEKHRIKCKQWGERRGERERKKEGGLSGGGLERREGLGQALEIESLFTRV